MVGGPGGAADRGAGGGPRGHRRHAAAACDGAAGAARAKARGGIGGMQPPLATRPRALGRRSTVMAPMRNDARPMGVLDVVIAVVLAWEAVTGYRRGFWLTAFEYLGVTAGFLAAAALTPRIVEATGVTSLGLRLLIVILVLATGAAVGAAAGRLVGEPVRTIVHVVGPVRVIDGIAGAALTAVVTLALLWYFGLTLSRVPNPQVATLIGDSAILRRLDDVAPRPPPQLARLETIVSNRFLPQVFAGFEPAFPSGPAPDPANAQSAAVTAAARSVVRVQGVGCGGLRLGSGFPVGGGHVVTNAHVVAGTGPITVQAPGDRPREATVILFDPNRDVAVLLVPELSVDPLALTDGEAGAQAAFIGYPGGGPETVVAASLVSNLEAQGRDIWGEQLVRRNVWVVRGEARPGDSGGALVNTDGQAVGVIFASSVNDPSRSFALTLSEITPDLQRAQGLTAPVNTRAYACAR